MSVPDTRMGGTRGSFPETSWSAILSAADPASPHRRERLNKLFAQYWKPVYVCIRAGHSRSVEEAKDLTQEFFARILEDDLVAKYEPERGSFRAFLKAALRFFLAKAHRDEHRLKRGGGVEIVPLDAADLEPVEESRERSPEEMFDRQWAREVLAMSLDALRKALLAEGREVPLRIYEAYELQGASGTYEELASRFGLSVAEVNNHLHRVRERLHQIIVERVTGYVASREDLARELSELFTR